jgi:alkanesulfonate monooxygenase SsuD/methylene tetrahydromethanopterin reductase-like flavin-dependent oxidoreductase (luciferase family)
LHPGGYRRGVSCYDRPPAAPRRPLLVGVQLPEVEREVRWPELLDMARAAEAVGLDSLWVGDHLLYRFADGSTRGPWEAWSLLAALAAVTTRVRLGPLVACTAFHHPAILAKQADTLDELSGGRFVLGLGAGWNEAEFRAFGIPFDHRISRFEEAFTIIRTLLRDGCIDFEGRFHSARDCELVPRGPTPGGPPIMLGSSGSRMLAIGAPHVDAWNAWYADTGNAPDGAAPLKARVDEASRETGRDPAEIARTVAVLVRFPGGTGRVMGDTSPSMQVAPLEGSPEAIADGLRAWAATGVSEVQLVLDPITRDTIESIGEVLRVLDR